MGNTPHRRPAAFPPTGSGGASARPPAATASGTRHGRGTPTGRRRLIDYPRAGKTGFRRWLPSWRLLLGALLTGLGLLFGALVAAYASTDIPSPADFVDAQTTTVYYSDGVTEMGTFGVQNRVIIDGSTIPDHVGWAVVAAEDRTFFENPGINPGGLLRALWGNVTGEGRPGGSSITQQYAERYYHNETISSYTGKIQEALLAMKLARAQDKDQILANYLNTIYLGRGAYGIETAARSYFGVGAADLTVSQAALIAGLIPSPNNWDPRVDPVKAQERWDYVLDGMVEVGALSQAERDAQEFPETIEYSRDDTYGGPTGYLLDMVRREIIANTSITEDDLDFNGYRIVTTIDPDLQQMAEDAVATLPEDAPENLRTALVTLDRESGAILALYGGPDYLTIARNAATQDVAQGGSTFKPFALVAYLEDGGSLRSRYNGNSGIDVPGFPNGVRNFGGQSFGEINVVRATAQSVNAVYAQMNVEVGPAATLDVARRAGVCADGATTAEECPVLDNQEVPANVLGTASPHPIDMAQAYNTFAAQGTRTEPFLVASVEYLDGGLVYEGGEAGVRVFDADVMADTTYALSRVVADGSGRRARAVGHPVAGKTGTSNDNRSAWFVGYSMHMTTAVAMYQVGPNNETEEITPFGGVRQVTGSTHPLAVWTEFMTAAHEGREVRQFPPRADIGEPNTPPLVEVPNVVGMPGADAVATLEDAGFGVAVERAEDAEVPEGTVASQSPGGGEAEQGATVTIVVSSGPPADEGDGDGDGDGDGGGGGPTLPPVTPPPTETPPPEDGEALGWPFGRDEDWPW